MNIQFLNRTDVSSVKIAIKNVDGGGSITTGMGVALVTTAASFDGVNAVQHLVANQASFAGVASNDIAINSWGKAICYGYAASILISNVGTSITVTAGDVLKPSTVAGTFFSSVTGQAMSTLLYRYVQAGSTNTISAAAYVSGLVHAM
jgi:hypothetical protein